MSRGPTGGSIIPSNKSSQTPQADSMSYPHSEPEKASKGLITTKGPVKSNGKQGKGF